MPNRLIREASPYLRQHADQPVEWYPWGEEAFQRARAEGKPILLSIGYSTCHWCHVMARESFADAAIAELLNEHFVAIKVDREERPDVDRVYMSYVQAISGHGGWPLNVWLTPDLKPFFGGTYFPPEDRPGHRGFPSLLRVIAQAWHDDREKLELESNRVIATLAHHTRNAAAPSGEAAPETSEDLVDLGGRAFEQCFQHLYEQFDTAKGGFGGAPKFPRAANLNFLWRAAVIQGLDTEPGREAVEMATKTLQAMAKGGIHDHVGGGFHRYSVDAGWFVPHFEKMLYDQAQIAVNYLDALQATGEARYGQVARRILDYTLECLRHPEGGFYAAEDADSDRAEGGHAEGAFYVWTKRELEEVLGGAAALVCAHFGVTEAGNVPAEQDPHGEFTGHNILRQCHGILDTAARFKLTPEVASARLEVALEQLKEVRAKRPRPHRDEKVVASWNGMMLSALAKAGLRLGEPRFLQAAAQAARFLRENLFAEETQTLRRSWCAGVAQAQAFAEDYALVIQGLLDLAEASGEATWLRWAAQLQTTMDQRFWDAANGGYFATDGADAAMILRLKEDYDGAEPAASSVAAANLFRWRGLFPEETEWERKGRATLDGLKGQWAKWPQAMPEMLCAIEWALEAPRSVVLVGEPATAEWQTLRAVLEEKAGPRRAIVTLVGGSNDTWLVERNPEWRHYAPEAGRTTAYVCERSTCLAPASDPEALRTVLG